MAAPGWPVVLTDPSSGVVLRPYRRSDAGAWSRSRRANEKWLSPWEPTPPRGTWAELNSPASFRYIHKELKRAAEAGAAMPFAICLRTERGEELVGQMTLGNIVRRAFCSAYAGYWVDARVAGRGVTPTALALAVDHAFSAGGLHRIEVNIRPENQASRRVVEKLGFREEAYHPKYLHIDGAWRDHIGYAITTEDVAADGGLMARWRRLRAGGSDGRGVAPHDRGIASGSRGVAPDGRGVAPDSPGDASDSRAVGSDNRAVASDGRAVASDSRGVGSDSRGVAPGNPAERA